MYGFILNMWIFNSTVMTKAKVESYVPTFITQEQCDAILATPQND